MNVFSRIKNFFTQKSINNNIGDLLESFSAGSLIGLSDGQPIEIKPRAAYNLSERNNDLGNAVNRISGSIAELKKGMREGDNTDLDYSADIVRLLNNPGGGLSGSTFWKSLSESYLLTQEGWIVARGRVDAPPLELVFIRPYDISVLMDNSTGYPTQIITTAKKDRRSYLPVVSGSGYRYISLDGLNEIFPIIGNVSLTDEWRGRSPLAKLYYDIKMNTDGKRHNVSLLKNGMKTTASITPKPHKDGQARWNAKTVDLLEKQLRAFNQGSGNAGNVLIMGEPVDVQGLNQSNKDMDYLGLLSNSQVSIYNLFQIPLPLVLPDTMTLDNYTSAQRVYYTKAVFPVFDNLADGLMSHLRNRYKLGPDVTLGFSEVAVRDLQPVLVENMKRLKETEAIKINEVRSIGGFEDVDGGDTILVNASQVPLEFVSMPPVFPEVTPDKIEEPPKDIDEQTDDDSDTE